MFPDELRTQLHLLTRAEKLRAIQFLVNEVALDEEAQLSQNTVYEVWYPIMQSELPRN